MRVLGVHPYAPDEVIKAAYRALVAKYHSGATEECQPIMRS